MVICQAKVALTKVPTEDQSTLAYRSQTKRFKALWWSKKPTISSWIQTEAA